MSSVVESNNPTLKTSSCAQVQEVNDHLEFLKLEHFKYIQYKIIYDILEEYIQEDSNTDASLKAKIRDIILSHSVSQTLMLNSGALDKSRASVLGIHDINSSAVSYVERNLIQEVLNVKLNEKKAMITKHFDKFTNDVMNKSLDSNSTQLQLSSEDKLIINYRNKVILEQEQYINNLLHLQRLLIDITDLRLKKLPEVTEQKIKECQVHEKINCLKSFLTQEKCRIDVFAETNYSLKAYKELIQDIKDQQRSYHDEIVNLKELKERYNQVSCKQYDDILKSYIQYKSSIEKKKILYDCLNN